MPLILDLIGDFTPVYLYLTREIERDPHAVAPDRCNAHNAQWVRRVADHDFFTFSASDHQHPRTSCPLPPRSQRPGRGRDKSIYPAPHGMTLRKA